MTEYLYTDPEAEGKRLDVFLHEIYPAKSRSFFTKLIKDGGVLLDNETVKAGASLSADSEIRIDFPEDVPLDVLPEDIPLDIVYEDADVILVNKPKGMVVHPAAGHLTGTLVNALLFHCGDLSGINGVIRPGIVHRIDMDTTGIVIACKNDEAHRKIAAQLAAHSITRAYYALACGQFSEESGTVDAPVGRSPKDRKKMAVVEKGKHAVTHYEVVRRYRGYTLLRCRLETGRTHQIRVHMAHIGHPLAGDPLYGTKKHPLTGDGQCLHAYLLGFVHPSSGEYMEFSVPLPASFRAVLDRLSPL